MLQIDLKPSGHVSVNPREQPESNPSGLNAYNSLNRANRIKEIAQIANDNRQFLGRLQGTNSQYSASAWENEYKKNTKISESIVSNSDRYCKNPYFLHSVCTHEVGQPGYAISNRAKSTKKSRRGSTTRKIMSSQGTRGDVNSHLRPFSAPKGINQEGRRIKIRTASGARRARQKQQMIAHQQLQQQMMQQQQLQTEGQIEAQQQELQGTTGEDEQQRQQQQELAHFGEAAQQHNEGEAQYQMPGDEEIKDKEEQ